MANNIAVSVSVDTAGLKAGMIAAKIEMQDFGKQARATYRDIKAGDNTPETAANFLRLSEAVAKAEATYALYGREIKKAQAANVAANDNVGQLRAGFQNLGFQLQDVSVQFASGQRAATIFAQQLPQVAGALTQIAQGAGGASGALGRFATFMSGPWGVAVGIGAAVLPPLIAKLFETGDAADTAKDKIYGLREAIAEMREHPAQALGKLQKNVSEAQGALNAARNIPIQTGNSEAARASAEVANANRERAIKAAEDALAKAQASLEGGKVSDRNYDNLRVLSSNAGRIKAANIKDDDAGGSAKAKDAGRTAAKAYREGYDEELRALQKTTDKLEATVFKPLADRTAEMFQGRDERAAKFFQERLTVVKRANAAELAETRRFEEQKRAIQERTVAPFAQSIARMLTLQRGFIGTVRDLWGSLTGIVEQAVARMVQSFLIGLLTQEVASEATNRKLVAADASAAASGAYKAVVGIPIIGPILAPIAAATAYAGVMAFSAEDGWDVPGGGGAGIDGRGGRPAIIHPREMVLPAQIADSVRALPGGLAAAASVNASLSGAAAQVADVNTGAFDAPRIRGGSRPGYRRARGGGSPTVNFTIQALDGPSVQRMLMKNGDKVAAAMAEATRQGWRPRPGRR